MMLSYRVRHVPIHMVFTSVAFMQVASDVRADTAIAQGLHKVSSRLMYVAGVYKLKAGISMVCRH